MSEKSSEKTEVWAWSEDGSFLFTSPHGRIVISANASAKCGRAGDYYECGGIEVESKLFVKEDARALLAAAPDMREALLEIINECEAGPVAGLRQIVAKKARAALPKVAGQS
jgi:hypothetical protein